jgi:hypothetical protein
VAQCTSIETLAEEAMAIGMKRGKIDKVKEKRKVE